mgnify:CR=1 FL=1
MRYLRVLLLMTMGLLLGCASEKVIDGSYRNPMIYADVPDMSVIRVGEYYYMVSTTMHLMPGAPVMRSKDLVNWETVSYLFDKLTDHERYDLKNGTVYGKGQWATSIRYNNGKFYALFSPNDVPYKSYFYTTDDPAKGWTLVSRMQHFHDASLFFDDDGKVYVFYGTGELQQIKSDLSDIEPNGVKMRLFEKDNEERGLLEGSQVFKHNGKYYLMMISWPPGKVRREVCYRADKITGPYEKKVILETNFENYGGVGQGCVVDSEDGNWYGVIFQDRGGVGRVPTVMPCKWVDGWPILGDENGNVGSIMQKKLVLDKNCKGILGSDDFSDKKLSLYWQWNHNPIDEAWSLSERKGHLRLKTARKVDNLFVAPNTITQRMEGPKCSARVKIDLSSMKDGDVAGFSAFNDYSGVLAVEMSGGEKSLTMSAQNAIFERGRNHGIQRVEVEEHGRVKLSQDVIYLRIDGDFTNRQDKASFYYSLDNKEWKEFGKSIRMRFDFMKFFMGTKYAIFNYSTKETGGYIDVDYIDYQRSNDRVITNK